MWHWLPHSTPRSLWTQWMSGRGSGPGCCTVVVNTPENERRTTLIYGFDNFSFCDKLVESHGAHGESFHATLNTKQKWTWWNKYILRIRCRFWLAARDNVCETTHQRFSGLFAKIYRKLHIENSDNVTAEGSSLFSNNFFFFFTYVVIELLLHLADCCSCAGGGW